MKTKILIIITVLLLYSCNKNDTINFSTQIKTVGIYVPKHYDTIINSHLIQDYLFQKGTFWIYKDSMNGLIDTCIVDSIIIVKNLQFDQDGMRYSKYAYNQTQSVFYTKYYLFKNKILVHYLCPDCPNVLLDSVNDTGDFYQNDHVVFIPTYTIDTQVYDSVYKIYFNDDPFFFLNVPDSGYYYLKAGVGIIKSEYYKDGEKTVYELMEYYIN